MINPHHIDDVPSVETCRGASLRVRALLVLVLAVASAGPVHAQQENGVPVVVDEEGVMRWSESGEEVALFGVNYALPFAFGYRAAERLGIPWKRAIDQDVDHLARLGLDAYRIHVWDREVSDREGNLVENQHLDLLDYLIARLQARGIEVILTPIAWWGPGYPEPDPPTQGFSEGRSKGDMTTQPEALEAQQRYLRQFMQHENAYTGRTYGEDPDIIVFELFNEPSHPAGPQATTDFIDALVEAVRGAGVEKPIFYNISQGYTDEHGRAVCSADIQGVAGQWYPAGLVRGSAIQANMLPNVDRYPTPWDAFDACDDKARMVYEFDPADVGGSYMYPAMARSFRGAGFQWATQFAYDPLAIAYSNTDYPTHFVNLVYAPSRALSLMIAGEAFRRVPRGAEYGTYPETVTFGPFRLSYEEDLSEMATDEAFLYSNTTETAPPAPAALRQVAGVGSSPVVDYAGTGAYFLDRLGDGVWRLEVYPDAVRTDDPFENPSLSRSVARILYRTWPMAIDLPDLGDDFTVEPLDEGNAHRPRVDDGTFGIRPGVYVLTRRGATAPDEIDAEFHAPPASGGPATVLHEPSAETVAVVRVDVVADAPVDSVSLVVRRPGWWRPMRQRMEREQGYTFAAEVPARMMQPGLVEYAVVVHEDGGTDRTFPGPAQGSPYDWDFTGDDFWQMDVVAADAPLVLFDARRDLDHLLYPRSGTRDHFEAGFVPGGTPGDLALRLQVNTFEPEPHHVAVRSFVAAPSRARLAQAGDYDVLRIWARAAGDGPSRVEVALVDEDGAAWGTTLELTGEWDEYVVPLDELARTPLVLLPRPYPEFLPYFFDAAGEAGPLVVREINGTQLSVSADLAGGEDEAAGFEVERIVLDQR